ncbi:MAG: mechanosensitive ion channel [Nitrosarchaeum sp.]|nr:mechanosensitive ion channel [Nitrosarchaeum sp.]MCA9819407.1 mechanosensitive ion channel [Nitrosarchaeum sp.]
MADEDVIEAVAGQVGELGTLSQLVTSSESLQISLIVLIAGLVGITVVYRKFSNWIKSQKFRYTRPHLSRFVRVAVLPFFAIALISSTNAYIQTFELFDNPSTVMAANSSESMTAAETFAKILNTINILVIGYTIAHLIPIFLEKREKMILEKQDFESWKELRGFKDDEDDLFHKLFKWNPPLHSPDDLTEQEFEEKMKTEEGRKFLECFHTAKGLPIGSYEEIDDNGFEKWKRSERAKYVKYFQNCISGNNESGKKLRLGQEIEEIYPIDIWREEKRMGGFEPIIPGFRPPGYAFKKRKDLPKSVRQILPVGIFVGVILGIVSWWGVDLFVLATATGGFAIGLGLALQETMQNWFAYIMIRKDKIVMEGERIQLETGYNGYVHKITSRVTYIRNAFNESFAVIPTRHLVNSQIINYSKEIKMVPAGVDVGVSYLNNPKSVASILVKIGRRVMTESIDSKGKHLVVQKRCPYLDHNKPSCGCDKGITVDIEQPLVRFNKFNDSSLDFTIYLYVRDYGSQFKVETDIRMVMYEEFKKYDIRIPWPIRTVYQGDEVREAREIAKLNDERKKVIDEFGTGDVLGGSDE